jgi:hypothetical protein
LVPGDYSYIDLEDILEDDDEGLGDQLGEGPGKLFICPSIYMKYMPYTAFVSPTESVHCYCILNNLIDVH